MQQHSSLIDSNTILFTMPHANTISPSLVSVARKVSQRNNEPAVTMNASQFPSSSHSILTLHAPSLALYIVNSNDGLDKGNTHKYFILRTPPCQFFIYPHAHRTDLQVFLPYFYLKGNFSTPLYPDPKRNRRPDAINAHIASQNPQQHDTPNPTTLHSTHHPVLQQHTL